LTQKVIFTEKNKVQKNFQLKMVNKINKFIKTKNKLKAGTEIAITGDQVSNRNNMKRKVIYSLGQELQMENLEQFFGCGNLLGKMETVYHFSQIFSSFFLKVPNRKKLPLPQKTT